MTKRYIFYAIIYIAVVAIIAFSVNSGNFSITILGKEITLPVALWFSIPVAILVLLSALHMIYYSFKRFLEIRAVKSDLDLYDSFTKEVFLGLDSNKDFKTPYFESAIACLKALNPWQKQNISFKNESLQNAYDIFNKVNSGEACDLRPFKLPKDNALFIQNEINKVCSDLKYAINVLGSKDEIKEKISSAARNEVVTKATFAQIKKLALKFDFSETKALINRYAEHDIEMEGGDLLELLRAGNFSANEYLECAKILKKKVAPDSLISIFRETKNQNSACLEAYLYLLYDLQMIDDLRAALLACEGERFEKIEALLALRDAGKVLKADFIYNL